MKTQLEVLKDKTLSEGYIPSLRIRRRNLSHEKKWQKWKTMRTAVLASIECWEDAEKSKEYRSLGFVYRSFLRPNGYTLSVVSQAKSCLLR